MLERIRELIEEAAKDLSKRQKVVYNGPFEFSPSQYEVGGLYDTAVAFPIAKQIHKRPRDVAAELKKYLEEKGSDIFSRVEVTEPGFINFWIRPEVIREELKKIVQAGQEWGKSRKGGSHPRGKVIVEYSQPNIAKPLQAHHLRSTIIGDAIANILEFSGYEVIRWNYLGDWGTHFGKLIALIKRKEPQGEWVNVMRDVQGSAAIYSEYRINVEEEPDLEEQAREEFKKLEQGDPENRKLWEESRNASIENLKELYKVLGVDFDEWIGESFYEERLLRLLQELKEKGVAEESKGALIIPLEKYNLAPALIRKSDGATLYLTRDIASLEHRLQKYRADLILYVVDNSQTLHFQQLFSIADILGLKGKFIHIKFGLLLGKDLKKLSSRAGTGIELESVMNEAIKRARKIMEEKGVEMNDEEKEEVAQIVGIGALKYNDISQNRVADIAFDWDKMLSLQGNSAPYLQYTYARLKSILRKAEAIDPVRDKPPQAAAAVHAGRISNGIEKEADLRLILKLAFFPEVIEEVSENYLPHQLANYLYDLARAINDYYEKEPILKAEESLRGARLHLVKSAAEVLRTGLALLGIKVPERM